MSEIGVGCGHIVDGHNVIYVTKEGMKAFNVFARYYGKKVMSYILERGGGFKEKYLELEDGEKFGTICSSCFSEWQVVK